jgi:hypothetical protein
MVLSPEAWLALAPVIGLLVDIAAHLGATWILRLPKLYPRLLVGAAAGGVATVFVAAAAVRSLPVERSEAIAMVAFDAATFAILSFGYFNFVQLNISSLRVRIANEIFDSGSGLEPERLLSLYNARRVVDERLDRLVRGKQIVDRDGRFYHRKSLVFWVAVAMDLCKRITLGQRVGEGFRKDFDRDH